MAAKITFNQWIKSPSARRHRHLEQLSLLWVIGRGRLTCVSVEKRAVALGVSPGLGTTAYQYFLDDTALAPTL